MNPLRTFCLMACLLAAACAGPHSNSQQRNSASKNLQPTQWLSAQELEQLPSVDQVTFEQLQNMPLEKGANLVHTLYHVSQVADDLTASFVPSPNNVPVVVKTNSGNIQSNLRDMVADIKKHANFGNEEVTIFITGLPETIPCVQKANNKLINAFENRYNIGQNNANQNNVDADYSTDAWKNRNTNSGELIVIDLGAAINSYKRFVMLDTAKTGNMIGQALVQLTNENDIPHEIIHVIGQGAAANVAGAAARQYTRLTGHQLRRVTGLDPANIVAKNSNTLPGLARGDAEFVDAIHTSALGMGTSKRVADVDFYPNGPSEGAPGADNVIEASMRATRYFAESVRPGNERNFPAVASNSLQQYKNNNGHGRRAYMGIATKYDVKGDYILQVNPSSPFGQSAPARKQTTYHGMHQASNAEQSRDYSY